MEAKRNKLDLFFPYLLPYFSFLGVITIARALPKGIYPGYVIAYTAAAFFLWRYWKRYKEIQGGEVALFNLLIALMAGLVGIAIWIFPYHYLNNFATLEGILDLAGSKRNIVEPLSLPKEWSYPFFVVRSIGYVFIVPIFEELFIRSFIWRYLINPDIESVAVGQYTAFAFWGTATLFALSHNQWIVAFLYALMINLLLITKKDLRLCMVAHGISNAALIVYVLISGKWFLW